MLGRVESETDDDEEPADAAKALPLKGSDGAAAAPEVFATPAPATGGKTRIAPGRKRAPPLAPLLPLLVAGPPLPPAFAAATGEATAGLASSNAGNRTPPPPPTLPGGGLKASDIRLLDVCNDANVPAKSRPSTSASVLAAIAATDGLDCDVAADAKGKEEEEEGTAGANGSAFALLLGPPLSIALTGGADIATTELPSPPAATAVNATPPFSSGRGGGVPGAAVTTAGSAEAAGASPRVGRALSCAVTATATGAAATVGGAAATRDAAATSAAEASSAARPRCAKAATRAAFMCGRRFLLLALPSKPPPLAEPPVGDASDASPPPAPKSEEPADEEEEEEADDPCEEDDE